MREEVLSIIEKATKEGRKVLLEPEAEKIFSCYGIPVPAGGVARGEKEALDIARQIGFPLVMKIVSPQVIHKTDVGGVRVGIEREEEVSSSYRSIVEGIRERIPQAEILGVLLQKMAPPGGREVIIGGMRDATFGPTVMFGLGGVWVEALQDVSFRIAPIDEGESLSMIREIKGYPILKGVRGQKSIHFDKLAKSISALSHLISDFPQIKEIDANPIYTYPEDILCVDARIILG